MGLRGLSQSKMNNLVKNVQKPLTFCLFYAKMNIRYSGIVGYFSHTKNKKQKQKQSNYSEVLLRANLLPRNNTFCFLSKRFFVEKIVHLVNQNKNKKYDCRTLPSLRHIESDRSQQNHLDSLGRTGINSQGSKRQSGLALLQQRTSRSDYQYGQTDQLLSSASGSTDKLKIVLTFLSFYFFQNNRV